MSIERKDPKKIKLSVNATLRDTQSGSLYLDVKKGSEIQVRFVPRESSMWVLVQNHYGLKQKDSNQQTLACLRREGTPETGTNCWLCTLTYDYLQNSEEEVERSLGKGKKSLSMTSSYYAQVWVAEKEDDGSLVYTGPRLLRLPKTGAEAVNKVIKRVAKQGHAHIASEVGGQDIIIENSGEGNPGTWYSADETGVLNSLDEIAPEWSEKFIHDIYGTLKLRVEPPWVQAAITREIYRDEIDWARVEETIGIPVAPKEK
jgi:hypothetical protein